MFALVYLLHLSILGSSGRRNKRKGFSQSSTDMSSKKADLAGPGIGNYDDLDKILPKDYSSPLNPKDTQRAILRQRTTSKRTFAKNSIS